VASREKAAAAWAHGRFDAQIAPVTTPGSHIKSGARMATTGSSLSSSRAMPWRRRASSRAVRAEP
jgi:hypothetical protein